MGGGEREGGVLRAKWRSPGGRTRPSSKKAGPSSRALGEGGMGGGRGEAGGEERATMRPQGGKQ